MSSRRNFLKQAGILAGGLGFSAEMPAAIARALAINPAAGSSFMDAEHVVFLMQENRSFDHTYGTLSGVRGFNDPRRILTPGMKPVFLQSDNAGNTYKPFRFDIHETKITWMDSLPHTWANQVDARNGGKHNGWLDNKRSGNKDYASMPLTLGFYGRADIPFYYALADAFTVCDQHFCSSLTGTTPNRLYFWTGTILDEQKPGAKANVWNEDADYLTMVSWKTFPERLEENGISWKVYQNELSVGVGFDGEEDPWLANFGDNPLEYFRQYHVKLHPEYISALPKTIRQLREAIADRRKKLKQAPAGDEAKNLKQEIDWLRRNLDVAISDQKTCTPGKFAKLSAFEQSIHRKAFVTNRADPHYHELETIRYNDDGISREVKVPKGDVLYQFRKDVDSGQLPAVSWLVAPENFSDHPASAWYGAWYISEVLNILTKNPDVWKKTIFILTYDENDGYFDHVAPFVPPHPGDPSTGMVSKSISTSLDYMTGDAQQSVKDQVRISPIGLGYRVPLVVASPWSRGGWVNSQVFDHTSGLRLLEKWLSGKYKKAVREPNISDWRRTVAGDLSSVFRKDERETSANPEFVQRDPFIESIHKAQFKNPPSNFRALTSREIEELLRSPDTTGILPQQESGTRNACSIPYEMYADVSVEGVGQLVLRLKSGTQLFGSATAGAPFHVYAPVSYKNEAFRTWSFTVAAGDELKPAWSIRDFDQSACRLCVHGPNGFFREFIQKGASPPVNVQLKYGTGAANSPEAFFVVENRGDEPLNIVIRDNAYGLPENALPVAAHQSADLRINVAQAHGWYDFSVMVKEEPSFSYHYAGHIETGGHSKTDPLMGNEVS